MLYLYNSTSDIKNPITKNPIQKNLRRTWLPFLLSLCITLPLPAQWTQLGGDIDGEAANDNSGRSVSLSSDGSVVAIGATGNAGNGNSAGHVRVYQNVGGNWVQLGGDIDGEAVGDVSGFSVSLSSDGSVVAIGAQGNDGNGTSAGHVRVYENVEGNWMQVGGDIDGEAAFDFSGYSVSLSSDGSVVAIGAQGNAGNGNSAGHVRVYENVGGNWMQLGGDIDGEAAGDQSGYSLSLSSDGSVVAIGAPFNGGNGTWAGHVRVYQNVGGNWVQLGGDIDGEAAFDRSGFSVSLSSDGSVVAIGANSNDGNGNSAGHVRVYQNVGGNWVQLGGDIDGEAANDLSGWSLSLSSDGSVVAIGAPINAGNGNSAGHVRVYQNVGGNWVQLGGDIDGEAAGDFSGFSVSLSSDGSVVAIGANLNGGNGSFAGHVRVYQLGASCNDMAPPMITCPGNQTRTLDASCNYTLEDFTGMAITSDDCGPVTVSQSPMAGATLSGVGDNTVTLIATDDAGNTATCTFTLTLEDNTAPMAVCKNATVTFNGEAAIVLTATKVLDGMASSDNCNQVNFTSATPHQITCSQIGQMIAVLVVADDGNGNTSSCTATVTANGLPCGFFSTPNGINCTAGNMASYNPATETYTITSEGCYDPNYYSNSDSHGYLGAGLCGDGQITAQISGISGAGWAGVAMRENLGVGAKMLQLSIDEGNMTKRELRQNTNAVAFNHTFQTAGKNWLRLIRVGNQFTAQHSSNGMSWTNVIVTTITMSDCIDVGLITENKMSSGTMTATFEDVEIIGDIGGLMAPNTPQVDIAATPDMAFSIFPNPTTGETFIKLDNYLGQPARIEIFNNLGQAQQWLEFDEIQNPTQRLDLSGYENGLYLIKVQIGDQPAITRKLMLVGTR